MSNRKTDLLPFRSLVPICQLVSTGLKTDLVSPTSSPGHLTHSWTHEWRGKA